MNKIRIDHAFVVHLDEKGTTCFLVPGDAKTRYSMATVVQVRGTSHALLQEDETRRNAYSRCPRRGHNISLQNTTPCTPRSKISGRAAAHPAEDGRLPGVVTYPRPWRAWARSWVGTRATWLGVAIGWATGRSCSSAIKSEETAQCTVRPT